MPAPIDPSKIAVANLPPQDDFDDSFDATLDLAPEPKPRPAAKAPPPEPPAPVHLPATVRRARKLGASAEMIGGMSSEELEDWIDDANEQRARDREQQAADRAVQNFMRASQQPTKPPTDEDDDLSLDEEIEKAIDPKVVRLLKKIPELVKENRQLKQSGEARAQNEVSEAVDEALEEIARPELYGEGDVTSIAKESREMKVRMALIGAAGVTAGDSPSLVRRKIKAAHKLLYGTTQAPKAAEPELEDDTPTYGGAPAPAPAPKVARQPNGKPRPTAEQYERGATQPPTNRGKKQPKSKQAAYAAVAQKMQEMQLTDDDFAYEEDGIPE